MMHLVSLAERECYRGNGNDWAMVGEKVDSRDAKMKAYYACAPTKDWLQQKLYRRPSFLGVRWHRTYSDQEDQSKGMIVNVGA